MSVDTAAPLAPPRPPATLPATRQPLPRVARGELTALAVRPRRRRAMPAWGWAILAVQATVLGVMTTRHEPWEDEAQAWLIARDASLWDLVSHVLRYEGSPGLWHLLLMPFARAGLPYVTIDVVAAAATMLGSYLVIRHAPFPWWVRALYPLSYYVLYQYGVVARSYCLLAPLLFGVAILHPRRRERPLLFVLLLALLANISVHGLLIAVSVGAVEVVGAVRDRHLLGLRERRALWRALWLGLAVLAVDAVLLLPPSDLSNGSSWVLGLSNLVGSFPFYLYRALAVRDAAAVVLLLTAVYLWRVRGPGLWLWLVPTVTLQLFFTVKYFSDWHEGALVLVWLFALWVAADTDRREHPGVGPRLRQLTLASVALTLAVHVGYSAASLAWDWKNEYSAAPAFAEYVKAHGITPGELDAVGYGTIGAVPYFGGADPYGNLNDGVGPGYYLWRSHHTGLDDDLTSVVARGRRYVVAVVKADHTIPCLYGYRVVQVFPGMIFYRVKGIEPDAYVLLERDGYWTGFQPPASQGCGYL